MKLVLTMGNNGSKKRNKTFEKFETEGEEGKGFFSLTVELQMDLC